ncbi:MAG: hypothetical protein IT299_06075 [Dehalococcoidia bacterium]|nr:hypothetical protein [Dehalococcoidia bacterium]
MNELVWEGLLEILREGQPSLKAAARLWRRDDFFGADWGGQLELPVVFRRLLPAEEYLVRLPSGLEGRARIASGPSTTTMTFPTLTGIGNPPFGASAGASDADAQPEPAAEAEVAGKPAAPEVVQPRQPAAASAPAAARAERTTRRGGRGSRGAAGARANAPQPAEPEAIPAPAPVAATVSEPPLAAAAPPEVVPAPAASPPPSEHTPHTGHTAHRGSEAVPSPEPAIVLRSPARPRPLDEAPKSVSRPARPRVALRRPSDPEVEVSVEQTEALARAFLAAVEARDRLAPLEREGFEGRAITAARQDVELVAAALETALRSMDGATRWADELRQPFALLAWFASLAAPDRRTNIADAGAAVESMLATIEGVLALGLLEESTPGRAA